MSRFTRLETAVLDALGWELSDAAPDLAGQFAESLPGRRINTGSGLYTEIIVAHSRPAPLTQPSGRFGTVHAMVADLPDPIAFQVELRQGRLLGLHGDAYGQDTRSIDFETARFDQVFTIDDRGQSVAFEPAALTPSSPLLDLRRHDDRGPASAQPALIDRGPLQRVQQTAPADLMDVVFGARPTGAGAGAAPPATEDQTSLLIGVWVVIGAVAIILYIVSDLGLFVLVPAVWLAVQVRRPKVLAAVRRGLDAWRAARAKSQV